MDLWGPAPWKVTCKLCNYMCKRLTCFVTQVVFVLVMTACIAQRHHMLNLGQRKTYMAKKDPESSFHRPRSLGFICSSKLSVFLKLLVTLFTGQDL